MTDLEPQSYFKLFMFLLVKYLNNYLNSESLKELQFFALNEDDCVRRYPGP